MVQINVNYKSDFNAILGIEGGWGVPFTARFWTQSPSRYFEASWDGQDGYKNCHRESDGRICFGFDNHNMGTGKLMMDLTFYLDNSCFADGICSEHITPFQPTFVRPVYDEKGKKVGEEEYYVMLDYKGQCSITTVGTLPAYYQAGLTPEEHQALIDATEHAEEAASGAEEKAGQAAEAARLANEARQQLTTTFNEKVAALEADYAEKKQMLDADYASVKGGLAQDYSQKKQALEADYAGVKSGLKSDYDSKTAALAQDYQAKKAALNADYEAKKAALEANYADVKAALTNAYLEAITGITQRMAAIEEQFATDKAAWQKAVEDAVNAANTAATEASRVNVTNNGTILTIVGRDGQVHTVNVKGEKGDPGESFTMFPNVTIFGQPRIQESQISGFSANDYVQMPMVVDFAGRPWQIDFAFTTGANVTAQQNIMDSVFGLAFAVANGKMEIAMSSNGTDWNLGAHFGTHNLSANTTYYVRITFDGTKYVVAMSTGGVEYVTDIQVASTASLYPRQIVIGKGVDGTHVFGGSIDLMKAHLVISGKAVWDGMADAGLATRMAVDMSNIDDAGKHKVLEIVGEGEVGHTIADLQKGLAQYERYDDIALTPLRNGYIINADGDEVAMAGWAYAEVTGIIKGHTYPLKMQTMEQAAINAKVAVFVGVGNDGKYTPLFSAINNKLPKSGYVCLYPGTDWEKILVCYKPSVTSVMEHWQFGFSISIANNYTNKKEMGKLANLHTQTKESLVDAINEVYAYAYTDKSMVYGVRHMYNDASSGLMRIGNEDLHATLPVQQLIRRCVLKDDGEVAYYLDAHDSTKKYDGTPANLDGTDGQVMVEIPQHYRRFTDNTELKAYDCEISLLPFDGAHMVHKCYISAYQATIHRPDNKLSSVASMAPEYRGGNNNASLDGAFNTMLGRPASGNVSLTSARVSAHNRGDGWEQMMYDAYVALYWLYVVEYSNLNSQLAFNPDRTDRGYRQGGLGDGVTTVNSTEWSSKFDYYPFVPCGITNELGNQTGVVLYDVPDAEEGSVWTRVSVPSYRGVENPFGQIWQWCDGFLAIGNGTAQEYFICHDRTRFASTKNEAYESVGMSPGKDGYVKSILRTPMGDILVASVGANSYNYFADYHYESFANGTTYGLLLGGHAVNGAYAGFVFGHSSNGPSGTFAYIGSRLCFFIDKSIVVL